MEIFIITFLKITKKASLHHKMLNYDWNNLIICLSGRYVLNRSNDVEICFKNQLISYHKSIIFVSFNDNL